MKIFARRTGTGFTLVEMLVVITIIILLVTMLMPALERTFELANRAKCARNLKSAGLAALNYNADFNFFPPNWSWGKQGEAPANYNKYEKRSGWDTTANKVGAQNPLYPNYLKNLDVLRCPSNVNTVLVDDIRDLEDDQPRPTGDWSSVKLKGYNLRFDDGRVFYFYEWNHNLSKIDGYRRLSASGSIETRKTKPPKNEKWHIGWYSKCIPSEPGRTYIYYEADDDASGSMNNNWDGSNHPRILTGTSGNNDAGGNIVFADSSVRWMSGADKLALQTGNNIRCKNKGGRSLKYGVYANPIRWPDMSNEAKIHSLEASQ